MNILIVEDDEKMVNLMKTGLIDQGVVSEAVNTGIEALERVSSHDYDLIVLDIMLPGEMDGFAVCREIRKRKIEIPIIMVTVPPATCATTTFVFCDLFNIFRVEKSIGLA